MRRLREYSTRGPLLFYGTGDDLALMKSCKQLNLHVLHDKFEEDPSYFTFLTSGLEQPNGEGLYPILYASSAVYMRGTDYRALDRQFTLLVTRPIPAARLQH